MSDPLSATVIFTYLGIAALLGVLAGRQGGGDVDDFVAGDRAFGPVLMYFVMGATIFSAYALLGTPQRIVSKGSDMFYIFAFGSVGFVPMFFMGARIRRIGARMGYVTQAQLIGGRFESRGLSGMMAAASVVSFLPYVVIQMKAAGLVVSSVTGWSLTSGAACVYGVVVFYVVMGGVRGVGWTNVLQGVAMLAIVWSVGVAVPVAYFGSVEGLFDAVVTEHPEHLTLPGPGAQTSDLRYSSEILLSALGFSMWPHVFMKCFTAKSARLVQLSVALYPSFLLFLVPLVFLGYVVVVFDGPGTDQALMWLSQLWQHHPLESGVVQSLGEAGIIAALLAFAILAASMSTGDGLLHGAASMCVCDLWVGALRRPLHPRAQTRAIRGVVVVFAGLAWIVLRHADRLPVVELLLLAYAVVVQFFPVVLCGLYWRGATRRGAESGLLVGLSVALLLVVLRATHPESYTALNPAGIEPGLVAVALNAVVLVFVSLWTATSSDDHLEAFELPRSSAP